MQIDVHQFLCAFSCLLFETTTTEKKKSNTFFLMHFNTFTFEWLPSNFIMHFFLWIHFIWTVYVCLLTMMSIQTNGYINGIPYRNDKQWFHSIFVHIRCAYSTECLAIEVWVFIFIPKCIIKIRTSIVLILLDSIIIEIIA